MSRRIPDHQESLPRLARSLRDESIQEHHHHHRHRPQAQPHHQLNHRRRKTKKKKTTITISNDRHDGDRWNGVDSSDLLASLVLESHSLETYPQCSSLSQAPTIAIWVERPMRLERHNKVMTQLARHSERIFGTLYGVPNVPEWGRSQTPARRHTPQIRTLMMVVERQ